MDPMQAPLAALCRYHFHYDHFLPVDFCTRTVAESVLCSQFLKAVREQAVDIDGMAEHLHRTQVPKFHHLQVRLTKVDTPVEFMQPVVTELINRLKGIQPQQADILQQFVDYKAFKLNSLAHAKQQLAEAGISPNQLVLRLPTALRN